VNLAKKAPSIGKGEIPAGPKLRVRDRIMQTARALFYCRGIRAVGVDTIANEAGTNKMSFYRNFASKDDLVAEYLRGEERDGWLWWDETIAEHAGIRARRSKRCSMSWSAIPARTTRAAARWPTPPLRSPNPIIGASHRGAVQGRMRRRFRHLAQEMGAREPDALGDALMLLWEAAI